MRLRTIVSSTVCMLLAAGATVAVLAVGTEAAAGTVVQSRTVIGYSVRHRPIVAYRLGDPTAKRTVLLLGQMHGDEHAGVVLADSLVRGTRAVEGLDLWVIPTMNPDGDAAHTRQNAHHVDLNRNWPDYWAHLTGEYYSGPKPSSEPETQAMGRFLLRVRPDYIVSLHQPLDGVDTTDGGQLDKGLVNRLAADLGLSKKPFRCWSFCHGSMTGWYTTHRYGIADTVEFGSHPSTSYLTGRAASGIVTALGGRFVSPATHDPKFGVLATGSANRIAVSGWGFDIDVRTASIRYAVALDGRLVARGTAADPSASIDRRYRITGAHGFARTLRAAAGRHAVCVAFRNSGVGTSNPRRCVQVTVPA